MVAVRFRAAGVPAELERVPIPVPAGTAVRLRVGGAGICRTDLHILDGTQPRVRPPITLGHEVAGWVDAVGPEAVEPVHAAGVAIGDAVVVFGGWGCGTCAECLAGEEQRCGLGASPGFQVDGGFAEHILIPHPRHLVALGDLDPVRAAPLGDAGVTTYRAVRRAMPWLRRGGRVLVIGGGALGQYALQHLRLAPAGESLRIVVSELSGERARVALDLGADAALLNGEDPDAGAAREALGGAADVVLDLVGSGQTLARSAAAVSPNGLVMLVGEAGGHLPFGFEMLALESWLTTTVWGSISDLRAVVDRARHGLLGLPVERRALTDALSAIDGVRHGRTAGRIVLVP
jgi:propanol-preferring alcohol dehydrogenase